MRCSKCLICLGRSETCRELSVLDEEKSSLKEKLSYIAPEVDWPDEIYICNNCSADLATACHFREQCLNVSIAGFKQEVVDDKLIKQTEPTHEGEAKFKTSDFDSDNESAENRLNHEEICESDGETLIVKQEIDTVGLNKKKYKRKEGCKVCGRRFRLEISLTKHQSKCDGIRRHWKVDSKLKCENCQKHYSTGKILAAHMKRCKQLPTSKAIGRQLKSESRVPKSKKNKFNCDICNTQFSLLKQLFQHYLEVHSVEEKSVRPYSCEICNNRFRTSTNLTTHMLYHEGNRTNICSICGKGFITKIDLMAHEQIHDEHRNHKCDRCGKAFKTNTNLRTHFLIVHTDPSLWKYECRICKKKFPQKSNHDQHFRRHVGEKNFICPLCKKPFTSKSEMQEHIGHHSNERPHRCEHCGKAYRKRHTYNVHLSRVHGIGNAKLRVRERKYECHLCPGKFHDKSKLARHLCTHSGLKPFPCPSCDKKFTDKSYLNQHLKTVHDDGQSEENIPGI